MKYTITPSRLFLFWITAISMLFLSSCASVAYYPPPVDAPMLKEKGEAKVDAGIGIYSVYAKGAYAFSDKLAFSGGLTLMNSEWAESPADLKGASLDVNIGRFTPLGRNGVFEIYGGYGLNYTSDSYLVKGFSHRLNVQPAIGWRGKYFEAAAVFRVSGLWVPESQTFNEFTERQAINGLLSIVTEPALKLAFGYKNFKFNYQLGMAMTGPLVTAPGYSEESRVSAGAFPVTFNVGLQYRFKLKR